MSVNWLLSLSKPTGVPWPAVILDVAREFESRNPELGVTGFLLFSRDLYLHFLEGPAAAMDLLRNQLAEDRRHDTIWMVTGAAPEPRLSGLTMGYFDADREHSAAAEADALWRRRKDWQAADAEALIAMLCAIAHEKYPSALSGKPPAGG